MAKVDVRKVEALVRRRSEHRATRDFAAADAVRDELSALGVSVYDSEAKWFVGFGARFEATSIRPTAAVTRRPRNNDPLPPV